MKTKVTISILFELLALLLTLVALLTHQIEMVTGIILLLVLFSVGCLIDISYKIYLKGYKSE